ncbi:MAG: ATP-binding protein [Planctomycetota bacterium]|jgi:hypothetical protein|nr:ATP-binding protein [Planctomycetota bacterium]
MDDGPEYRHIRSRIRYLQGCFERGIGGIGLTDIFARRVDRCVVLEGEEAASTGVIGRMALSGEAGTALRDRAYLARHETQLNYGVLFLCGSKGSNKLCAPLLLYAAQIEEISNQVFITPDPNRITLNHDLLDQLDYDASQRDALNEALPDGPINNDGLAKLLGHLTGCATSEASTWPHLISQGALRHARNAGHLGVYPAAAAMLLRLGQDSRGIRNELDLIAQSETFSPSLLSILDEAPPPSTSAPHCIAPIVPAVLSAAQSRSLVAAQSFPLSLVIGPPGTGKTFTIANLALDQLARGQTCLISARRDAAVKVIVDKITGVLGDRSAVLRAGRGNHRQALLERLENLRDGVRPAAIQQPLSSTAVLDQDLDKLETQLRQHTDIERRLGPILEQAKPNIFDRLRAWWLKSRKGSFGRLPKLIRHIDQSLTQRSNAARQELLASHSNRVTDLARERRQDLKHWIKALRARSGHYRERHLASANIDAILSAFPIVACPLNELAAALPLDTGCFDLGIIDEASQCDLASVIPLLQRCQRVVVVGDPKQLRHVSFLAQRDMQRLASEAGLTEATAHELDFRHVSLVDRATEQICDEHAINFLDEHYRGLPDLIAFSNQRYYGGALRVMSANPSQRRIQANKRIQIAGQRLANGSNPTEVTHALTVLRAIIKQDRELPKPRSVGLLAPFRDQADALQSAVSESISVSDQHRHDIAVGTPYAFQGAERDVMIISLTIDQNAGHGSLRYLCRNDVFNVMITRAKAKQLVLHSFSPEQIDPRWGVRTWLDSMDKSPPTPTHRGGDDHFLSQVQSACQAKGWTCYPLFPIAGLELDLVLEHGDRCLGLDLIGSTGDLGARIELERYRMLKRAGLPVIPVALSDWIESQENCLKQVELALATAPS